MSLSSFLKKFLFTGLFFLAIMVLPNPLSDKLTTTVHASNEISIDDDSSRIKLNVKSKEMVRDEEYTLKVYRTLKKQRVIFRSSKSSIVSVKKTEDKEAVLCANEIGEATITAYVKEGFKTVATLKCNITVTPPAISIKIIDNRITIKKGDIASIRKELKPSTTAEVPVYYTNKPDVISISSKGVIKALEKGSAYLYAYINNGSKFDYCIIEVV